MCAAREGHTDLVKMLYEDGADIFYVDKASCYYNTIQCYIPLQYGKTPLIWAASHGHTDVVKIFHEFGADISYQDNVSY